MEEATRLHSRGYFDAIKVMADGDIDTSEAVSLSPSYRIGISEGWGQQILLNGPNATQREVAEIYRNRAREILSAGLQEALPIQEGKPPHNLKYYRAEIERWQKVKSELVAQSCG